MSFIWKKFPNAKPRKDGWYQCTLAFESDRTIFGETVYQTYVMDLYWYSDKGSFCDNRRQNVFDIYQVFSDETLSKKIDTDRLVDRTNNVVAWRRLHRPYKEPHKLYKEG